MSKRNILESKLVKASLYANIGFIHKRLIASHLNNNKDPEHLQTVLNMINAWKGLDEKLVS